MCWVGEVRARHEEQIQRVLACRRGREERGCRGIVHGSDALAVGKPCVLRAF